MKKTSILIIEDNDDIRESTTEILELANYQVFHADNGKTGVELAIKHLPDIILCDIMMPELDGYGVLFMLGKTPETSAIPFIFLTAKAERVDMRKGMEMGADDYLTKPFDDVELLNAIESRLQKREKQEAFYNKSLEKIDNLVNRGDGLAELQKLVADRKIRTIKKKQIIFYEGDSPNGLYLLLSGKVKTYKISNDDRELLTSLYGPDEYIGVNALLSNDVYHETAEAVEDSSICMLPREMVDQLVNHYPEVGKAFIKIIANNLKEKEDQLLQLAYHSVRKRMSQVLLRLAGNDPENAVLRISRDDLASMAGMATETVSRTLSDFKTEGLIEKKGSQIIILNAKKLINMKN
jgi:CRP-like cAMP-binding protein/CheY-like chemotaxis protein